MSRSIYLEGMKMQLDDGDYLSAGGEATVWLKAGRAIKLWDTPPPADYRRKLETLRVLAADPAVIAPRELATDQSGNLIGYAMDAVDEGLALPKLFTSAGQARHGIGPADIGSLLRQMIATIRFVHEHGILLVDANECNYLVTRAANQLQARFIDVDSWQVPGFPATVIMPSIRDWSAAVFSADSDWFSFAIIATQLYLGIHPFKGSWRPDPSLKDLRERQLRRLSVFNLEVSVPPAVRSFSAIPANFRDWLTSLFEAGCRGEPPLPDDARVFALAGGGKIGPAQQAPVGGVIRLEFLLEVAETILALWFAAGSRWITTIAGLYRDRSLPRRLKNLVGVLEGPGGPWLVQAGTDACLIQLDTGASLHLEGQADQRLRVIDGRLYRLGRTFLEELVVLAIGGGFRLVEKGRWPIAGLSTAAGEGAFVADCLGAAYLYRPWMAGHCSILRLKELDGHRILVIQATGRVVMALTLMGGQYWRCQWHFAADHSSVLWHGREVLDGPVDLHFAVVKETLVVEYLPDDSFRLRPLGGGGERLVVRAGLVGLTWLTADRQGVLAAVGSKLFRVRLEG